MSEDQPQLLVEEIDNIMVATLNRPEKLNALTRRIMEGLHEAVDEYARRSDLRCFLIRARGRYFSAGADLHDGQNDPVSNPRSSAEIRQWYRFGGMQSLYYKMEAIEKPFVAAHQATCVGGGLELSLSCDFRLAAQSARYSFPENKLGSIPASNGVSRLTHLCGPNWAKYMILAARPIDAQRALMAGLVCEIFPDEDFEETVLDWCRDLARQPPEMAAMAKLTIDLAAESTPDNAKKIERLGQSLLQIGDEQGAMLEAMKAKLRGGK